MVQQMCLAQGKVKDFLVLESLVKALKGKDEELEKMMNIEWIAGLQMFIG